MDEKKREHILDTSMKLFNECGFHGMPTSKIAKESGVSVGTLFNYFPTKEDLIVAIYMEIKKRSKHSFIEHLYQAGSEYELLKLMWHNVIEWGVENPEEFKYVGLFHHSPFKHLFKSEKIMSHYAKLRETIFKMISPTTICKDYPEFSMIYLNNTLRAATDFIIANNIVEDREHFINSSFDLFWNGFGQK